jgi:ParB family chromosome partitioning protein
LLRLPAAVQGAIRSGSLSVGHAKVIAGLPSEKLQGLAASRVLKESLNVRQTERLVETLQAESEKSPAVSAPRTPDAHVASVEGHLRERLGTKVRLRYASGKGAVEISFFSDAELERILQLLGISLD